MKDKNDQHLRRSVLGQLGGSPGDVEELLVYNENRFDAGKLPPPPVLPQPDEPHVSDWRRYAAESRGEPFEYLQARFPQLCIPIQAGVSAGVPYANVIRRGHDFHAEDFGGRLELERPRDLRLLIHDHDAGALPVLRTSHRPDFETLTRALAFRGEPKPINPSVNAQMIAGIINWDRVRRYRTVWTAEHGQQGWSEEMARVSSQERWRFHDSLILVCDYPYSDIFHPGPGWAADANDWIRRSHVLRIEHEFSHHATRRLYQYMALNLLDEIICDWAGMTAAMGRFDADAMCQFLGLEDWPGVRPTGRVHTYRQQLSDGAFGLLCALTIQSAHGLESLSAEFYRPARRRQFYLALTQMTLESLAAPERFQETYDWAGSLLPAADPHGGP